MLWSPWLRPWPASEPSRSSGECGKVGRGNSVPASLKFCMASRERERVEQGSFSIEASPGRSLKSKTQGESLSSEERKWKLRDEARRQAIWFPGDKDGWGGQSWKGCSVIDSSLTSNWRPFPWTDRWRRHGMRAVRAGFEQ